MLVREHGSVVRPFTIRWLEVTARASLGVRRTTISLSRARQASISAAPKISSPTPSIAGSPPPLVLAGPTTISSTLISRRRQRSLIRLVASFLPTRVGASIRPQTAGLLGLLLVKRESVPDCVP